MSRTAVSPAAAIVGWEDGDLTDDRLLDGRVVFRQPARGYRVAVDTVLLAAAVPVRAGERVLELGSGVGGAALCLAGRVPGCRVDGIECERGLVALARDNAARNGFAERIVFFTGDVLGSADWPEGCTGLYDHVMTNPPFHDPQGADPRKGADRRTATVEAPGQLDVWIGRALARLRPRGSLTVIFPAARLPDLLAVLTPRLGAISVLPLWPAPAAAGRPAKRVIVQGRTGRRSPLRLLPGLVLHRRDGRYSAQAERVLRHAQPLVLEPAALRRVRRHGVGSVIRGIG